MLAETQIRRIRFRINGQVQGVGFRPFVYRLASEMALPGWVINDSRGVTMEVQGRAEDLKRFAGRLKAELPPLAQISRFSEEEIAARLDGGDGFPDKFEIRASDGGEMADAQVTVDTAVCGDCLREMNDPADPRYHYPFINCTNCGPRYTIVTAIPYDRPNTTMTDFPMCPLCRREYTDPANRRFHAQPVACPKCGPGVWLVDSRGVKLSEKECEDPIARTAELLAAGKIVAIKGLGGFHLACRADDDHVVRRLRQRKRRDAKPFALMVADLEVARSICQVTDEAAELLSGHLRPIVILPARGADEGRTGGGEEGKIGGVLPSSLPPFLRSSRHPVLVAPSVAQGLNTLGIMLPYAPLHFLLFAHKEIARLPLVMTSGNYSEEPLVKDNDAAVAHMGRIADFLLLHNRRIERRVDDSVVQLSGDGRLISLRRARGYAPRPVQLGGELRIASRDPVLAVGGELKNTICLLKGDRAVLSEHIGDLKDGRVYRHFIDTINHLEKLFEVAPATIAADLHPQYLSTEYALHRARKSGLKVVRVQHHYAHVAACMAENGQAGPVIGLACDGTGYGQDGAVWGCEVLKADLRGYERLGHLRYMPLPGGDAAAAQTYRPALSALREAFGDEVAPVLEACRLRAAREEIDATLEQLARGVNCPPSSSLGRWFDAVAGLCGLAEANLFEGQAPMALEAAIRPGVSESYKFDVAAEDGDAFLIDPRPMVRQIVDDLRLGADAGEIAARFHNTVAAFLLAAASRAREMTGLQVVALSGGCFANRYLMANLVPALEREKFTVLRHTTVPCNDGCVALGQAVVAAAAEVIGKS
ncbi:MAG: carbamoyltransferase HypF [Phycisphaerae bacterium]